MSYIARAKEIFAQETEELNRLRERIDSHFDKAIEMIYACEGKVVLMGIGKTGIIGRKIAASMASTGTPAIFINAAEAVHGDLGMVSKRDVVILVSNSGSTQEILSVIGPLRKIGCKLIALTGDSESQLATACDITLSTHVDSEVCPLGLAPTTSTTATLMMGDALTVVLMEKRQFKAENFAVYHPGGALGRQLTGHVEQHMQHDIPRVDTEANIREVAAEMTRGHLGMTMVYRDEQCCGIITDGDLRRAISRGQLDNLSASSIMTPSYKHIPTGALMSDALAVMDKHNITTLAVTDEQEHIIGILSIHHIIDFN